MSLDQNNLIGFVENHIGTFHQRRLDRLRILKLSDVVKRKNPYLFKAKAIYTAQDFVKLVLDAYLSSQEETIFGEFMEQLAIYVSEQMLGGRKSAVEGIDLELTKNGIIYLITIKSGPNWGNSSQIRKMIDNFKKAQRILRTNNPGVHSICINGCCYGKEAQIDKLEYYKICGQDFWTFISGDPNLYIEIIEPIGNRAKEKNEAFYAEYGRLLNVFTSQFLQEFCNNGNIDWPRLVAFNSASSGKAPLP